MLTIVFVGRSFIIQLAGALFAISRNVATSKSGFHIYTAGVALQQFFILCFIVLATVFHRPLKANRNVQSAKSGERLLYTMYAALFLISVSQISPTISTYIFLCIVFQFKFFEEHKVQMCLVLQNGTAPELMRTSSVLSIALSNFLPV